MIIDSAALSCLVVLVVGAFTAAGAYIDFMVPPSNNGENSPPHGVKHGDN